MTKTYTILHIPSGNYIIVELYGQDRFNQDLTIDDYKLINEDLNLNLYLSKEFIINRIKKTGKSNLEFNILKTKNKESLIYLLNDKNSKLYRHICMDIFNTIYVNEYLHLLDKSEFEAVEIDDEKTI